MNCPHCASTMIIKNGKRKTRYGDKQRYRCNDCESRFVTGLVKYKMYPPQVIYHALTYYDLGYSGSVVSRKINKQFKIKTGTSTIYTWLEAYQHLRPISTMRADLMSYEPVVVTKQFEHENLEYIFMYHRFKLDTLVQKKFPQLARYITSFERGCPNVFFEVGERCSQPRGKVDIVPRTSMNLACAMAAFAVQATRENRKRHTHVETFMLINDTATVACEVPVWYWDTKIDTGVTGHIDMVQIRNNMIYVLDYKPNAARDKQAATQLYHYARALSFRTATPLKHIRCAWFDEHVYYEYKPSEVQGKVQVGMQTTG